ncbi:D-tyrosyl-tRNA(Tyr) deacylase [Coemansia nantahalensis]|uniref:D-tyrosyl-tRNA(Tyr) deacylase n=1 Tax=Coemansia helicoidea TaxID=1286919 RepID=A0ACC1KX44_9FUNG|nr:D-tyrosyl-tRNA(Tyr) deacylase [Coemansia nantahalensis]KAJ2796621.1 D-tyrosyl-tRNA(Tyr) deacylase [Coemansia helicoidea]
MRVVLQKVARASVTVGDRVVGAIGPGICVLVGVSTSDTDEDMEYMARKVLGTRVFDDSAGNMWKKSVQDRGLEVLCVSQFTLYGSTAKGMKPDFHQAMKSAEARQFFDDFVARLGQLYDRSRIATGEFGAMMQVELVNDGPVTLELDSRRFSYYAPDPAVAARNAAKDRRRQGFAQPPGP